MLECNKVYIDSRFKTFESASNTDFKFELPDDLYMPPNTKCYIDEITIPITYYSVESNMNDKLYFRLMSSSSAIISDKIITLDPQNYDIESFRDALQAKLNTAYGSGKFTVEGSKRTNVLIIRITTNENFQLFSDFDLIVGSALWTGVSYNVTNLQSFNNNMKNAEGRSNVCNLSSPFVSGFVDFLNLHSLYLHSNISSYNSMNHTGKCNVVKKICVTTSWGFLQNDVVVMENDYTDVSNRILKTLEFSLRDVYGNVVPLHGANISFTLRFVSA